MYRKILYGVLMFLLIGGSCLALSQSQQATFQVSVASVFELSIDQGFIDFGRMRPGETRGNMPSAGLLVTAKTNSGRPWSLKISDSSAFSSGPYTIPNDNFIWSGWTDGAGRWYGTGKESMTITPTLVYGSGAGEETNLPNGVTNHFRFKLNVPSNQRPGTYQTTVKFTMTE